MAKKLTTCVLAILIGAPFMGISEVRAETEAGEHLGAVYPGLTSGALSFAVLGALPEGVLLKAEDLEITSADLKAELEGAKASIREQLAKNKLFLLENLATAELLVREAEAANAEEQAANAAEQALIQKYLEGVVAKVEVSDEEVAAFYDENKDMFGGASLEQIKDQLRDYVLGQKKQEAAADHIETIGQRMEVVLASGWVADQAKMALDNPVDAARASGKPSLIDFGSTGCRPCDMMAPILDTLETKYEGKLNVRFIHVGEEQILAARYGIQSIPVQIFFDKDGKEVFRHTGFYAQADIEKRLKEMGVE